MPSPIDFIKSRTRQRWKELVLQYVELARQWIQALGERAAIATFVLGLLIAIFFKLFLFLVTISILVAYLVWYLAPQD